MLSDTGTSTSRHAMQNCVPARCAACRYDLAGLHATAPCPECGHRLRVCRVEVRTPWCMCACVTLGCWIADTTIAWRIVSLIAEDPLSVIGLWLPFALAVSTAGVPIALFACCRSRMRKEYRSYVWIALTLQLLLHTLLLISVH